MAQKVSAVDPVNPEPTPPAQPTDSVAIVTVEADGKITPEPAPVETVPEILTQPSAEAVAQVAAETSEPVVLAPGYLPKMEVLSEKDALAQYMEMLTYRRPHNSKGESEFIDRFLMPLNPATDNCGNFYFFIGDKSTTLFSCHTDTVHRDDQRQEVSFDEEFNMVWKNDGHPLGADDCSGMWIMLQMMARGIEGTYLFHRGEECGGIGSGWIARNDPKWLKTYRRCVAFDRKNIASVITHQGGSRCCSDEFATALALALNANDSGLQYGLDKTGVFTDSANYTEVIPECTNLSVGYYDEHTQQEMQDTKHLFELMNACCKVQWEALPALRKPEKKDYARFRSASGVSGRHPLDDEEWDARFGWVRKLGEQEGGVPVYDGSKSKETSQSTVLGAEKGQSQGQQPLNFPGAEGLQQSAVSSPLSSGRSGQVGGARNSSSVPQAEKSGANQAAGGEAGTPETFIEFEACLQWVWENQVEAAQVLYDLLEEGVVLADELEGVAQIQDDLDFGVREYTTDGEEEDDIPGAEDMDGGLLSAEAVANFPKISNMVDELDDRVAGMAQGLILPLPEGGRRRREHGTNPQIKLPIQQQQPGQMTPLNAGLVRAIIAEPFKHHTPGVSTKLH